MIQRYTREYTFDLDNPTDNALWNELLIRLNQSDVEYSSTIIGSTGLVELRSRWSSATTLEG